MALKKLLLLSLFTLSLHAMEHADPYIRLPNIAPLLKDLLEKGVSISPQTCRNLGYTALSAALFVAGSACGYSSITNTNADRRTLAGIASVASIGLGLAVLRYCIK